MHPVICQLGPFTVYSYGLMFAVAVFTASYLASRDAAKIGIASETVYDLVFWVVIAGVIGARVLYVLLTLDYFLAVPQDIVMLQKGGLAWQGGLVCGGAAGLYYLKRKGLSVRKVLDLVAPYIALGHAIGRIGCFLNGCCFGKAASWGLWYPVWHERMQPTQLYMVAGQLAIFLFLRYYQPKAVRAGQVFILYLFLSSAERFLIEFARADHELYFGLSITQYVCMAIFAVAIWLYLKLK